MIHRKLACAAATLALLLSSGCHSLFSGRQELRTEVRIAPQPDRVTYANEQISLGREALDSSQYGLAIVAFRNVRPMPEYAAIANNGLAIAYAQMGRPDLSRRYFEYAIAQTPHDSKYRANLARFEENLERLSQNVLATTAAEQLVDGAVGAVRRKAIIRTTHSGAVVRIELPQSRIVRVSASEVRVGASEAVRNDPRRRAPARTLASGAPVTKRLNPRYPARIALPVTSGGLHAEEPARRSMAIRLTAAR